MKVRRARADDAAAIHDLIKAHADRGKMILRPLDEIYASLREFFVCELAGRVVGCAAAHIFWSDLAELKCLAVAEECMGQGVGAKLCAACHGDMDRLGVRRVFALSSTPGFFEKIGYRKVEKDALPRFIWGECVRCPSFPICNEEAMVLDIQAGKAP